MGILLAIDTAAPRLQLALLSGDSADTLVEDTVKAIRESCMTGEVGDGKIFLWTLDDAVRIRTGDRGNEAL